MPTLERDYPVAAARVHAGWHRNDEAFASLERAYAAKDTELYRMKSDPFLRSLEGDPRYKAFLRKMNLSE